MRTGYSEEDLLKSRLNGVLPEIDIAGHPFLIDWRLKELRPKGEFASRIDLSNMAMDAGGENYLCFYHLPTKNVITVSDHITALPKDTVMLEIPYELRLDPVGTAREYGLEDRAMLEKYPIQKDLKAKVVPLEETGLPGMIKENLVKRAVQRNIRRVNRKKGRGL